MVPVITRQLISFYETVIERIEASFSIFLRVNASKQSILKFLIRHTTDILVTRSCIPPHYGIDRQSSTVFQIKTSAYFGSLVFYYCTRNNMCTIICRHTIFSRQVHTGPLIGFVLHYAATGHHTAGQHEQSAAFDGFVVTNHTVAYVCPLRHDGTATTGVETTATGRSRSQTVFQIDSVKHCLFIQSSRSILSELYGMITVHRLTASGLIAHCTQHSHILRSVAIVIIPVSIILIYTAHIRTFIISAHHGHAFRNHERVTLRIVRISQRIGMIHSSITFISGNLHNRRITLCHTLSCRIQHFLQLHGTGCISRRRSVCRTVTVKGHIIHSVSIRFNHIFILAFVSTGVHRTVFHAIGEVHVGKVKKVDIHILFEKVFAFLQRHHSLLPTLSRWHCIPRTRFHLFFTIHSQPTIRSRRQDTEDFHIIRTHIQCLRGSFHT